MINRYDKLDCMLFAAAVDFCKEEVERFENLDVSDVPETQRYIRKRNRMIAKQRRKPAFVSLRRFARSVAVVLVVIFALGFITIMSVSAFRNAVIDVIVDWFDDYVQVEFEEDDPDENAEVVIEDLKRITALPEGTVEEVSMDYNKVWMTTYLLNNERICSLRQEVYRENTAFVDNVDTKVEYVDINGEKGCFFIDENGVIRLYWNDGKYVYLLTLYDNSYDIMYLAESIK